VRVLMTSERIVLLDVRGAGDDAAEVLRHRMG
jgi:hypothetical protein